MLEFHKEVNGVEYRIIHRKGFSIIGFRKRITLQFTGENHQIDSLNVLLTDDARGRLLAYNNELPNGIVSVSAEVMIVLKHIVKIKQSDITNKNPFFIYYFLLL